LATMSVPEKQIDRTESPRAGRIDAHHHLWKYSPEEYPWMLEGMDSIRRDFLIEELDEVRRQASIDAVVTVQARQSLRETDWLLDLASRHGVIRAVVGWVPLTDTSIASVLEGYSTFPKLRSVRHVLHDEADDFYMLRNDFNKGIALLQDFGLCYDILVFERHLPQTIQFVDRHPNQTFVLDHIGKPRIRDRALSPWREHIHELAKRENVYCKLSGLVTEANWKEWTEADLRPYIDVVLESFGPERVMFASDWPVSLMACTYGRWVDIVTRAISQLTAIERDAVFGETAKKAYNF
jgi:L-fucono-1,5-lactonase